MMPRLESDAMPAGSSPRVLLRLARYLQPFARQEALCLAFLLAGTVASLATPLLVRTLLDRALPARDPGLVLRLVAAMALLQIGYSACMFATDFLFLKVGNGILFALRRDMHDHLMRLSMDYFGGTKAGQILARIMGDVDAVQGLTTNAFLMLVTDSVTVLVMLGFMLSLSGPMTLLAAGSLVALFAALRAFNGRMLPAARANRETYARISEELHEGIAGAREIRAFGCERRRSALFQSRLRAFADASFRMGIWGSAERLFGLFVVAIGPLLAYLIGGLGAVRGTCTVGTLVAFVAYMARLYEPVQRLMFLNVQMQCALGAVERVFAFLDTPPTVMEAAAAKSVNAVRGTLAIENVTFRYGTDEPALRSVTLRVRAGEKLAIVGPSGAGKSTIAHLLLRFFDPQEGRVLLDGADLRTLELTGLRRSVALVPQETFLFHSSVAENLAIGKPGATAEEIRRAAEFAGAAQFIASLPEAYETLAGERGARLSGGQRQRLSIARAFLVDPAVVIFDEATSSLDPESERLVKRSMDRLMEGRTTIIISHRLATVVDADRIVVLDRGKIAEEGTHASLIEQDGLYTRLYLEQIEGTRVAPCA
jgi:ABC-type multidrug transport system fused ATPase/permease subunit